MEPLRIATVQFETRDNDKMYNLSVIRDMCRKASVEGADVVAFHECSVCGYTFAKDLSYEELLAIAEPVPTGESTQTLIAIAKEFNITLLAGFFERDGDRIYKAQVCVDGQGLKAKYRKLHLFINPHILPGDQYVLFDIKGWKCGILIYHRKCTCHYPIGSGYYFHAPRDNVYSIPSSWSRLNQSRFVGKQGEQPYYLTTGVRWFERTSLAHEVASRPCL